MSRTARTFPPAAISRDSYMSTASGMTDSSQSTVMTDIWDHGSPNTRLGSPNKAGWRTSQIGSQRNYGYGASASSRPFYKRASTNVTIPDEPSEKKEKSSSLEEVDETAEDDAEQTTRELSEPPEEAMDVPEADEEVTLTFEGQDDHSRAKADRYGSQRKPLFGATSSWTTGYPTSPSIRSATRARPETALFFKAMATETSSPLPDRQSLQDTPRTGSRTSHIAAALEALESKSGSGSEETFPITPTRSRPSKRVSSKIQSIGKSQSADHDTVTQRSGMKASPSIMALRNTGGIRNRISMIENNNDDLPPIDAFRITHGSRQNRTNEKPTLPYDDRSPAQSVRSPSHRSSRQANRHLSRHTTVADGSCTCAPSFAGLVDDDEAAGTGTLLGRRTSTLHLADLQSPVETSESFGIDTFYGEGSRGDADIGDLAERRGDVRVGSLVTTSSGNLIHLPNVAPLNLRRPPSSTSGARWAGEKDSSRLQAVHDMEAMTPKLSEQGTRSTEQGNFNLLTPTLSDMRKEHNLPLTPPNDGSSKTISLAHFSTSKALPTQTRVPPPQLTPQTAAASIFRAPSAKTVRTAAWIQGTSAEAENENVEVRDVKGPETIGRAKALIDRFEAKTDLDTASAAEAKSLPSTPMKRSARQIGLGTPPAARANQTESRIGSGRAGMRGELSASYTNNRDKPLPAIYPYANQYDRGLRPPERTWTNEEVVIPVSPPRANGKSSSPWNAGHSPLKGSHTKGKSPLKDFIGKLHDVRNKVKTEVGRRRAGTIDKCNKSPSWSVPAYRAEGRTNSVEDVFGNMQPLPRFREKEAENGLGHNVGVAHSVLSSSVATAYQAPMTRDRMGDAEMQPDFPPLEVSQPVIRESTGFCLLPPPCSTSDTNGSWQPVELRLTAETLGISESTGGHPLSVKMRDCTDIRSIAASQAATQGISAVFSKDGTQADILEICLEEGNIKRYIAIEGLSNRLGWVSALWGAVLSSQRIDHNTTPSEGRTQNHSDSVFYTPFSMGLPSSGPLVIRNRDATPNSVSTLRMSSGSTPRPSPRMGSALRNSVQGMFETPVEGQTLANLSGQRLEASTAGSGFGNFDSALPAERELSLFSRSKSLARTRSTASFVSGTVLSTANRSDEILGFDESDLNPSRSASQRAGPARSDVGPMMQTRGHISTHPRGPARPLPQPKMPSLLGPRAPACTFPLGGGQDSATATLPDDKRDITMPQGILMQKDSMLTTPLFLPNDTPPESEIYGTSSDSPSETQEIPATQLSALEEAQTLPKDLHLSGQLEEDAIRTSDADLPAQLETVRAEARLAFSHSKLLQEQTDAIKSQAEAVRVLSPLVSKMDTVHLDIKDIQNSLQIAALSALNQVETPAIDLDAVHSKLDALALALSTSAQAVPKMVGSPAKVEPSAVPEEVSETPAKAVLSVASGPVPAVDDGLVKSITGMTEEHTVLVDQVKEVLSMVQGLQTAREAQAQQTSDMAKYLGQLNGWLEQFVIGSTKEMQNVAGRLERLVTELAPEPTPVEDGGGSSTPANPGIASLVNQVHGLMLEQKQRTDEDASTAQRVDNLLNTMVEDRNSWTASLDNVRQENEQLLRAMATDLTSEIRGERLRFVEAMREATSVNVSLHIEEFKNMLNTEVSRNMQELTQMREQKRALELQLSDYFALMAKTNKGSDGAGIKPALPGKSPAAQSPLPLPPTSPHA